MIHPEDGMKNKKDIKIGIIDFGLCIGNPETYEDAFEKRVRKENDEDNIRRIDMALNQKANRTASRFIAPTRSRSISPPKFTQLPSSINTIEEYDSSRKTPPSKTSSKTPPKTSPRKKS
jgi:hypothetical protein